MNDAPATQPSLLIRLRDAEDGPAWARFVDIYAPLVYDFGRRHGLQDADAADLTQEVLLVVFREVGGFERRGRGAFRGWLREVLARRVRDHFRQRRTRPTATGAKWSNCTRVATLVWADVRCPSVARSVASSHRATSRGVASTGTSPERKCWAVSMLVTVSST